MRLLQRVRPSIQSAKASHAQLTPICLSEEIRKPFVLLRIPLIQRREKYPSPKEKSTFSQWFSSVYVHSLKDQARQSKYPRTQILGPHTQSKLICRSSITFIPMRSNNLIEVTSQSYIGISPELYSFLHRPIQIYPRTHIPICGTIEQAHLFITRSSSPRKSESLG